MHPRSTWNIFDYFVFSLDMLSSAGYEMVIFFFTLSGFFIRYAQLRKHRQPLAFYVNRIVRVYPPYLFSVLLACGVLVLAATLAPQVMSSDSKRELSSSLQEAWQQLSAFNLRNLVQVFTFQKNGQLYNGYNEVYWSLLPEALFYLGVPLFFWRIKWYYSLSALIYAASFLNYPGATSNNSLIDYFVVYNFYFALGVALYDLVLHTKWLDVMRRSSGKLLALACLVLFGMILGTAFADIKILSGLFAALLAFLSISALLAGKVSPRNWLIRSTRYIGIRSFSLYLYHFPLLILCYIGLVWLTGDLVFYQRYYWLAVVLVTLVSVGLYRVTERLSVEFFRKM